MCVAGLLLTSCSKRDFSADSNLLRISQRNEPATLDPHLATLPDEFFLLRALSEGLVVPNPNEGPPLPGVAAKWTMSDDELRWTFSLRRDARWSNGDPVTAQDFVDSIRRALTPALGAPKANLFYVLKNAAAFHRGELRDFAAVGCVALDEHTLQFDLAEPAPHLLALLASGPWLPVHRATVEKFGDFTARENAWTQPGNLVGNGPFVLREWRKDQHLLVERNVHYHSPARVRVAGIRFQVYDSGDTEERAFRAGQVDVTMAVPFTKLDRYEPPMLRRQPLHETRYFALNTTVPPLNDPHVRRALALAIDRDALVGNVLRGGQTAALAFMPPGIGGYKGEPRLAFNPTSARAALAEAGFPEGRGFPRLEIAAWGVNPVVLEAVQQMWRRELGIETAIVQREGRVHMAAVIAGDCAIAFMPAIPDYDDPSALFDDLVTGATSNHTRWSDGDYDQLVADARRSTDPTQRLALYREAERLLMEELPVVPLYFNSQNYLVAPRVKGWRQDALWNRSYLDVSLQ